MSAGQRKLNYFLEKHENGQKLFECQLCKRVMKSKRSVLEHLFQQHSFSPVKKSYISYENDENKSVPRSTLYRWQAHSKKPLLFCENSVGDDQDCELDVQTPVQRSDIVVQNADMDSAETSNCTSGVCDPTPSYVSDSDLSSTDTLSESDISAIDTSTDSTMESGFENDALVLLNCFREHKLTDSACHDILKAVRHVLPGEKGNPLLNYKIAFTGT